MACKDPPFEDSSVSDQIMNSPSIHVSLPTSSKMLRSPSRESVATEMSVFSVSSFNSDFLKLPSNARLGFGALRAVPETRHLYSPTQQLSYLTPNRGPSPIPGRSGRFLKVPNDASGGTGGGCLPSEVWCEEETDLNVIKSCSALSTALGLQKSFSTGDIMAYVDMDDDGRRNDMVLYQAPGYLRNAVSDIALGSGKSSAQYEATRFGMGTRSLSTWVAVGDVVMSLSRTISSQLPSPQGRPTSVHVENPQYIEDTVLPSGTSTAFTAADLIRSVNKRVRQHYIRRRLLTTYKALERLSQSQFNLDQIAAVALTSNEHVEGSLSEELKSQNPSLNAALLKNALTINDVEREQGRPLSKYERNMMIFNWLHTLEESQSDS